MLRRGHEQARGSLLAYDTDRPAVEAARRDPRQFEALYRKYVAQIYSFALYELRDPTAAEDVTATVFMRALEDFHGHRSHPERIDVPHLRPGHGRRLARTHDSDNAISIDTRG